MNKDFRNLGSHYNKYIYPKPIENIEEEVIKKKIVPYADPNFNWHILWPEKPYNLRSLRILIAGCGSDQASVLARCNPNHKFIGVDFSEQSINHQKKLKQKNNLNNLELICDDFRNVIFKKKFDYIISTGVLHHLINPGTALDYFYNNLKDKGVIYLMIYGDKQSYSLKEMKKIFNTLNLKHNHKSIEVAKRTILNLNSKHPAKIFSQNTSDFDHDAGIVDFLLHKKERFFEINEIIKLLKKHKLIIKNFFDGKISSITKFFLYDIDCLNIMRNLDLSKKLELGQILNWDDRKIKIVICKDKEVNNSLIYNKNKIEKIYIYPNRSLDYSINENTIIIKEKDPKKEWEINIPNNLFIDWETIFKGKVPLSYVLNNIDNHMKIKAKNLFEILIENHFVDVSYYSIGNYSENYGR